jgi:DHA1 family inner membrane transport protein
MTSKLLVLMLSPFAFGTGAYVFTGLLDPMAVDLGVSVPVVGQLQSAFAIASALGGPVLAVMTSRYERKRLLVVVLFGLAVANAASAMAGLFSTLVVARIAAGLVGALTLPVASAIAVGLVGPEKRAPALAVVFSGMSLAFLIGIPVGSFVGAAYGWPASFWLATLIALFAAGASAVAIPKIGHVPAPPEGAFQAALRPPAKSLLAVTFLSFVATFASVAFIGPLVTALTGLEGGDIGWMQLFIGIGSLVGLALGARLATSRGLTALTPLMLVVMVTQGMFTLGLLAELTPLRGIISTAIIIFTGSAALFALAPIVQAALAEIAGPAATVAFALNGSVVFLGQGLGAVLGGGVIAQSSLTWTGLAGAGVAVLAFHATRRVRAFHLHESKTPESV